MTMPVHPTDASTREQILIERRRDFHKYAEPAWCEVRTASIVAGVLRDLGFEIAVGKAVLSEDRMGLPSEEVLAEAYSRALLQGADPQLASEVAGGFTGVVGVLRTGRPGPTVALRFDIDANYGYESSDTTRHRPAAKGFASVNYGIHHSCGHDAHTAMGLSIAELLAEAKDDVAGEVRLVFQPAEEGLRGGSAMVKAGVVDDVDYLIGCHIGVQARKTGEIIAGYETILASEKIDARFEGKNAHAGISPQEGLNAIQAAAIATQNLLAITRHGDGETRINVGQISGGETRNSVPAHAWLRLEVRADNNDILHFLTQQVHHVLHGAGYITGVATEIETVGGAESASSDAQLVDDLVEIAGQNSRVTSLRRTASFKGSDDMSSLMNAVQESGGKAIYFGLGADLFDVHHAPYFDFDEASLLVGVEIFEGHLRKLGVIP
jgi:aminobenzoyl-glutamate utilization protein A